MCTENSYFHPDKILNIPQIPNIFVRFEQFSQVRKTKASANQLKPIQDKAKQTI